MGASAECLPQSASVLLPPLPTFSHARERMLSQDFLTSLACPILHTSQA